MSRPSVRRPLLSQRESHCLSQLYAEMKPNRSWVTESHSAWCICSNYKCVIAWAWRNQHDEGRWAKIIGYIIIITLNIYIALSVEITYMCSFLFINLKVIWKIVPQHTLRGHASALSLNTPMHYLINVTYFSFSWSKCFIFNW